MCDMSTVELEGLGRSLTRVVVDSQDRDKSPKGSDENVSEPLVSSRQTLSPTMKKVFPWAGLFYHSCVKPIHTG